MSFYVHAWMQDEDQDIFKLRLAKPLDFCGKNMEVGVVSLFHKDILGSSLTINEDKIVFDKNKIGSTIDMDQFKSIIFESAVNPELYTSEYLTKAGILLDLEQIVEAVKTFGPFKTNYDHNLLRVNPKFTFDDSNKQKTYDQAIKPEYFYFYFNTEYTLKEIYQNLLKQELDFLLQRKHSNEVKLEELKTKEINLNEKVRTQEAKASKLKNVLTSNPPDIVKLNKLKNEKQELAEMITSLQKEIQNFSDTAIETYMQNLVRTFHQEFQKKQNEIINKYNPMDDNQNVLLCLKSDFSAPVYSNDHFENILKIFSPGEKIQKVTYHSIIKNYIQSLTFKLSDINDSPIIFRNDYSNRKKFYVILHFREQ